MTGIEILNELVKKQDELVCVLVKNPTVKMALALLEGQVLLTRAISLEDELAEDYKDRLTGKNERTIFKICGIITKLNNQ